MSRRIEVEKDLRYHVLLMSINLQGFVTGFLRDADFYSLGARIKRQFLTKATELLEDPSLDPAKKGRLLSRLHEALPVLHQEGYSAFDAVVNLYHIDEKNRASESSSSGTTES